MVTEHSSLKIAHTYAVIWKTIFSPEFTSEKRSNTFIQGLRVVNVLLRNAADYFEIRFNSSNSKIKIFPIFHPQPPAQFIKNSTATFIHGIYTFIRTSIDNRFSSAHSHSSTSLDSHRWIHLLISADLESSSIHSVKYF